jgi:Zn-dependent protease
MKTKLYNFHYRGIPVFIHWTFLLVVIWFVIANILTGFHANGWIWSLIMLFSILASLFVHDLAQAIVGTIFGIEINGLIIMPIGGLPSIANNPPKKYYEILMLAAGPAANLSIAGLLLVFLHPYQAYWNEPENIGVAYAGNFIFQLQFINLSLGLLNLLPSFPMDGGRVLDTLLEKKYSSGKAKRIVIVISFVTAFCFFAAGAFYLKYPLLMIGLFILFTLRMGRYYHPLKIKPFNGHTG